MSTALPYEFGRNFWHNGWSDKLQYVSPDIDPVVTGYAVFNRLVTFSKLPNIIPAPFNNIPYNDFYNGIKELLTTYINNPSYTWQNTLKVGQPVPSNVYAYGTTDLFASFCLDLSARYGNNFVYNVWKNIDYLPNKTTTQGAVDNFYIASCSACNVNLYNLFTNTYKWPISNSAKALVDNLIPLPVTPNTYGGLGIYYPNYNNTNTDIYVSTGYPISAIFNKSPGFDIITTSALVSALDKWGLILNGSQFNSRIEAADIYNGEIYVPNPLSGIANTSMVIYISSFFADSGDLQNTLGYAGISFKRRGSEIGTNQYNIPYRSFMVFNTYYTPDDVNTITAGGKNAFYYTALHEIGHTLGIGTNWFDNNGVNLFQGLIVGAGDNTPNPLNIGLSANFFYSVYPNTDRTNTQIGKPTVFDGVSRFIGDADFVYPYNSNSLNNTTSKAVSAYNLLFNTNLTAIPVENGSSFGRFGSVGSHWEEGYATSGWGTDTRNYYGNGTPGAPGLNDELMTPQSEGIYDAPLSQITIGSLEDLGYTVNYTYADTYDPKVYNIYSNSSSQPLSIGFYGNTYSVFGWTSNTNSGKWIVLKRGLTYSFNLNTSVDNPIYIVSQEGSIGAPPASQVTAGVTGDGTNTGTLTWDIPTNHPTGLYYLQSGENSLVRALLVLY
jgi:hypothetical protein